MSVRSGHGISESGIPSIAGVPTLLGPTSCHIPAAFSRRDLLCRAGGGFGALALSALLAGEATASQPLSAPGASPRRLGSDLVPRAKAVIFLFMVGGPSH